MLGLSAVRGKTAVRLRFFGLSLLAALATGSARADEPVSFKGKTVTMTIGFAAGGGTDLAGRLIAAHLGK
jgi:tripartite-type tricarboxylate transporter receptor subunit TctC